MFDSLAARIIIWFVFRANIWIGNVFRPIDASSFNLIFVIRGEVQH